MVASPVQALFIRPACFKCAVTRMNTSTRRPKDASNVWARWTGQDCCVVSNISTSRILPQVLPVAIHIAILEIFIKPRTAANHYQTLPAKLVLSNLTYAITNTLWMAYAKYVQDFAPICQLVPQEM